MAPKIYRHLVRKHYGSLILKLTHSTARHEIRNERGIYWHLHYRPGGFRQSTRSPPRDKPWHKRHAEAPIHGLITSLSGSGIRRRRNEGSGERRKQPRKATFFIARFTTRSGNQDAGRKKRRPSIDPSCGREGELRWSYKKISRPVGKVSPCGN